MKVYLIRHGETTSNKEKRYMGVTDVPLSEEGIEKIRARMKENYYPKYDGQIFYSSTLSRTRQTLQLIYEAVDFIEEAGFNESNFGDFENKTYEELKDDPDYIKWISGNYLSNQCPNGESYVQMKERVTRTFDKVVKRHKNQGKDIIIVLHSGPIVALMESLHPEVSKNYYEWRLENGEFYQIEV